MNADGIMMGVFGRRAAKLGKDAKYVSPSHPCLHLVHPDSCYNLLHTKLKVGMLLHAHTFPLPACWCARGRCLQTAQPLPAALLVCTIWDVL